MITDTLTIIRKEWKEIFLPRGSWKSGVVNQLIILAVLGVFLPVQSGPKWLANPALAITWLWLPVMMTMNLVADAFAGERERHTLDTLLASRLSDQAILNGKIAAAVLYGVAIALLSMLVGAVTVNLAYPTGSLQFYPLLPLLAGIVIVFQVNLLMAALGVLISLKAPTARQAYQQLTIGLALLTLVPFLGYQLLPADLQASLSAALAGLNASQAVEVAMLALALVCAGLVVAARARFQRSKLIE